MSTILHVAARVKPPKLATDIIVLASSTTHDAMEIPDSWYGSYITIQADGCDVYFGFSTSASAEVSPTATSTLTGDLPNTPATVSMKLVDGQEKDFDLSLLERQAGQKWYLIHEESAGSAYVRVIRSSGPVSR